MRYRRLGHSGLKLSALSYGSWLTAGSRLGRGETRELVALAWDHGVNFFDNAENYAHGEAERVIGDVIADLRLPRDGFCVSSKVRFGSVADPRPTQAGLSRKHVRDACHDALRRLRVAIQAALPARELGSSTTQRAAAAPVRIQPREGRTAMRRAASLPLVPFCSRWPWPLPLTCRAVWARGTSRITTAV